MGGVLGSVSPYEHQLADDEESFGLMMKKDRWLGGCTEIRITEREMATLVQKSLRITPCNKSERRVVRR